MYKSITHYPGVTTMEDVHERTHMNEIREENKQWEERQRVKDAHMKAYLEEHPEQKEAFEWDIRMAAQIRKNIAEQEERFKKYEAESK